MAVGKDPPPNATVSFMGYYNRVGRAKPHVPTKDTLRRSFSNELRIRSGAQLPPSTELSRSKSNEVLLPTLKEAIHAAEMAARPRKFGTLIIGPKKDKSRSPPKRPATSPDLGSSAGQPPAEEDRGDRGDRGDRASVFARGKTGRDLLASVSRPSMGPSSLEPLTQTQGLGASALLKVGQTAEHADTIKMQASRSLRMDSEEAMANGAAALSPLRRPESEAAPRRPPPLGGSRAHADIA